MHFDYIDAKMTIFSGIMKKTLEVYRKMEYIFGTHDLLEKGVHCNHPSGNSRGDSQAYDESATKTVRADSGCSALAG